MKPALSRIGMGCVTFGREISEDLSLEILDYAWENGITVYDTAESYGGGASERIVGKWLRTRGLEKQATIATKASLRFDRRGIEEALNRSLERLQLDSVAIYLLHRYDAATPLEESLAALTDGIARGLIRCAGCSNFSADRLAAALEIAALEVTQPIYNLVARDIETDLLPLCREREIAVMSYSPLGAGFLTGKYSPQTPIPQGSRFSVIPGHAKIYFSPEKFGIAAGLRRLSAATGSSPSRLALGWALHNPLVDCVLIGARTVAHVQNAIEALRRPLPAAWIEEMDRMSTRMAGYY